MARSLGHLLSATLLALLLPLTANAAAVRWINAAGGNWSLATNWSPATVPTATDTAVVDLPGTYTVTVNQNFAIAALRVSGAASGVQTVSATSRTLTFSSGSTIGAQGAVLLSGCTLNGAGALVNEGLITINSGTTISGPYTNSAGSTLRIQGTAALNAAFTVANGFTNSGAIQLTSVAAATTATLTVTSGVLVNAPTGTISSLAGSGGTRTLNAQFDNQGTITVAQALTTNKASVAHTNSGTINLTTGDWTIVISGTTPSFTTSGTVSVGAGRLLTLQGGVVGGAGQNFNYNGGSFGGAGTIALLNSTLNLNGTLSSSLATLTTTNSTLAGPSAYIINTGTTIAFSSATVSAPITVQGSATWRLTNCDVTGALDNSGTVEWLGANTSSGPVTTQSGSILRILASSSANASVTYATGFTNTATIELTATGAATASTLTVTSGTLVNAPTGVIRSMVGSAGSRNLNAKLDNQGTITVEQNLTTNKASVAHTNSGTVNLTTGNWTIVISGDRKSTRLNSSH